MTEQTTVEFMGGGPLDGAVLTFDGDVVPPRFAVLLPPSMSLRWGEECALDVSQPGTVRYRREPSDLDDGPLWVYVPDRA